MKFLQNWDLHCRIMRNRITQLLFCWDVQKHVAQNVCGTLCSSELIHFSCIYA